MKRILQSSAMVLLSAGLAFSSAESVVVKAPDAPIHAVVPVKTGTHKHHGKKRWKHSHAKTKDQAIKGLKKHKESVMKKAVDVPADEKAYFDFHVGMADHWIQTLESFKDSDTRFERSAGFGHRELRAAKHLAHKGCHKRDLNLKKFEDLKVRLEKVRTEGGQLLNDNKIAFDCLIKCAESYVQFIEAHRTEKSCGVSDLVANLMRYINTAELFAHRRTRHTSHEGGAMPVPAVASPAAPADMPAPATVETAVANPQMADKK